MHARMTHRARTQTDVGLVKEMLKQKAACSDSRAASTWSSEQQSTLQRHVAAAKLGSVLMSVIGPEPSAISTVDQEHGDTSDSCGTTKASGEGS